MLWKYLCVGVLATSMLISGCATQAPPVPSDEGASRTTALVQTYRIGIDDQLNVNVWRNNDLSISVPVRPDGKISVPLIGDVDAGGKTPEDVASDIERKLAYYLREPQVTVVVTDLRSHEFLNRVRVTGAVQTPLSMSHRQGMTVLDVVLEAGGTTEFAAASRAKLYRRIGGETKVFPVHLDEILGEGKLETNYSLQPGDIVTVPERIF